MAYTSTILITGGTTGLGYQAALQIAAKVPQAQVVIASRNDANDAAGRMNKTNKQNNVAYLRLDLGTRDSVRDFVNRYQAKSYPPISALLLNAGSQFPGPLDFNADGIEKSFAINHVGHALLFHLLYTKGLFESSARTIITGSGTHDPKVDNGGLVPPPVWDSAAAVAKPDPKTANSNGRERYATSKLGSALWLHALHRRLAAASTNASSKVTVVMMDPGLMPGTDLNREGSMIEKFLWYHILPYITPILRKLMDPNIHSTTESGAALAALAIDPKHEGVSGKYFEGTKEIRSSDDSYDIEKQDDLWQWTVKFVSQDSGELEGFDKM